MATILTPTMTERVRKLRQQSLETVEAISIERAELLTEFYKQDLGLISVPVQRAMAFAYLMEHKHIDIYDGELIVGEKGDKPKAAPTFPELCCHTLEDLHILDTRPLTSFKVSPKARKTQEEVIIPYWQGKSIGDLVRKDEAEMLKFKNFGRKSLMELGKILEERGLHFGMSVDKYIKPEEN